MGALLFLTAMPLPGQEGLVTENRFVTLIKPKYEQGYISLSFEPIDVENLHYRVYRSEKPIISESDIEHALMIAEISKEEIPLKDLPPEDGQFYYAVTVIEEFPDLIPYLNTTTRPIDFSPMPEVIDTFDIKTLDQQEGEERPVAISFFPARADYTYKLYTSKAPITDLEHVEPHTVVTGVDGQFKIGVQENVPIFLAITVVNRLGVENETLIPGRNVTSEAFNIETEEEVQVVQEPKKTDLPEKKAEPESIKETITKKEPSPAELIEKNLRINFYRGNYSSALDDFQSLLERDDLTRNERGTVLFYAGQCFFYLRDYEKAVRYFVLSKDTESFEGMADAWIERSLGRIR